MTTAQQISPKVAAQFGFPSCRPGVRTTDADLHVSQRLRAARKLAGLSQEAASVALGVSFQQLQKYESGANRITAGKMIVLAKAYDVPVAWFFEGLPATGTSDTDDIGELLASPVGADLAHAILAIEDIDKRRALLRVAQALA